MMGALAFGKGVFSLMGAEELSQSSSSLPQTFWVALVPIVVYISYSYFKMLVKRYARDREFSFLGVLILLACVPSTTYLNESSLFLITAALAACYAPGLDERSGPARKLNKEYFP